MTVARQCDACRQFIEPEEPYAVLDMSIKRSDGEELKDVEVQELTGDYCFECIGNGKAMKDMVSGFPYLGGKK